MFAFMAPGQILNTPFVWFRENVVPRVPINEKVLGGCVLCTAFWLGFIEMLFIRNDWTGVALLFYNAAVAALIYKNL
jgi:hypothetical protein